MVWMVENAGGNMDPGFFCLVVKGIEGFLVDAPVLMPVASLRGAKTRLYDCIR